MSVQLAMVSVLGLLTVLFLLKMFTDYLKDRKRKPVLPPVQMQLENDIQFLNYVINHKINQTKIFILDPLKMSGKVIINDKDFYKYNDDIVEDVYDSLSPTYKRTMGKYFTEESLRTYITELIFKEMTAICLGMNFKTFFNRELK